VISWWLLPQRLPPCFEALAPLWGLLYLTSLIATGFPREQGLRQKSFQPGILAMSYLLVSFVSVTPKCGAVIARLPLLNHLCQSSSHALWWLMLWIVALTTCTGWTARTSRKEASQLWFGQIHTRSVITTNTSNGKNAILMKIQVQTMREFGTTSFGFTTPDAVLMASDHCSQFCCVKLRSQPCLAHLCLEMHTSLAGSATRYFVNLILLFGFRVLHLFFCFWKFSAFSWTNCVVFSANPKSKQSNIVHTRMSGWWKDLHLCLASVYASMSLQLHWV
jgi:hypothetical protein